MHIKALIRGRRRWGLAAAAVGLVVLGAGCLAAAPPAPPPFVVSGESLNPPLATTTFVQSQPGQPPGTPCSLFPSLPTSLTVTATVAPVNGQVPDSVGAYIKGDGDVLFGVLAPTSPGSTTWTGTVPITDGGTVFTTNPMHFYVTIATQFHPGDPWYEMTGPQFGVVQACS